VLPLLRVDMLGRVVIDGAPLYRQVWEGGSHSVFKSRLFLRGWAVRSACLSNQVLQVFPWRADSWAVASPSQLQDKPESWSWAVWFNTLGQTLFSGKAVSFSSLSVSPQWQKVLFSPGCGWATPPTHRLDQPSTL
jgi:hypothetical protein